MTRKLDPAKVDNLITLYTSGKTMSQISAETGIGTTTISRYVKARGIEARTVRKSLPDAEIVSAYVAGESELTLAQRYGVERNVVRRRLEEAGVEIRNRSEANTNRMARLTPEERAAQTAAAHAAMRGRRVPEKERLLRAARREETLSHASAREGVFAAHLETSLPVTPQKAIGPYNVDFAVGPIAVEILGGSWHAYKPYHAERTPYILNQGWHMLFIWDRPKAPLCIEAAEYVVAWAQKASGNPAAVRQYRVIRGDAKLVASGSANDQHFPLILPSIAKFSGRPID
ncbi:hypothetical protein ACF1BS_03200 [Streptomyces sp. NPDC014748]|uniref:hypothetical protein n=1 Tax=Streptomyces sp. NPDC014748 TaxID=3364905 RepID=UPI0036FD9B72